MGRCTRERRPLVFTGSRPVSARKPVSLFLYLLLLIISVVRAWFPLLDSGCLENNESRRLEAGDSEQQRSQTRQCHCFLLPGAEAKH